jgi:SNF2 family DNA or RNA helicase
MGTREGADSITVLVLLLRLRQVCSHPSLILENGAAEDMDDAADDPVEHKKQLANARKLVGREFVQKMQDKVFAPHQHAP